MLRDSSPRVGFFMFKFQGCDNLVNFINKRRIVSCKEKGTENTRGLGHLQPFGKHQKFNKKEDNFKLHILCQTT